VINAVQAMPEGGSIWISAANETVGLDTKRPFHPGDYVHISVADSGTGVQTGSTSSGFRSVLHHQANTAAAGPDNGLFDHPQAPGTH